MERLSALQLFRSDVRAPPGYFSATCSTSISRRSTGAKRQWRRYVHPQAHPRSAQCGHKNGHRSETAAESEKPSNRRNSMKLKQILGRGEWIRTTGLLVPNQALYQAEPRPD